MKECPTCFRCFSDDVSHCPEEGQATINSLPGEPALEGRYLLERRLGQGGMGVVYKAHHVFLKSPHAIKVIMSDLVGNDPSIATRFRQEAIAAAAIRHPNIISVTDYGFIKGEIPFLVMEFVEGNSLQDVMSEEGKFPPEKALEYIRAIASGVGAAHHQGIVHRDLKPLNIMIQGNRALRDGIRILDFGLAKIKSGELLGSFVGAKTTGIIGSPYYMAPEQWSDEEPDKRCDIYSLGIILHQMLTGDVPFKGTSIPAVMKKHLMTPPPPLASARGGISPALERVVHHALEKEPKARTATAEDLVAEFEKALEVEAVGKPTARRRVPGKAKPVTSRAKAGVATLISTEQKKPRRSTARVTAEQKKAKLEEEAIARRTADQEDVAREKPQGDEVNGKVGTVDVIHEKTESDEELISSSQRAREESSKKTEESESQVQVESTRRKVEEQQGDLSSDEQESWRRAADEARRRAEERALFEAGRTVGEALLTPRVPSLAPRSHLSAVPEPSPSKPQIAFGDLWRKPLVLAIVGILIVVAVSAYFLTRTSPPLEGGAKNASAGDTPISRRDMALIQGGSFTMGSDRGPEELKPAHLVTVSSFYIDKTEVTNEEYAVFVKETGHVAPLNNDGDPSTKGYWQAWRGNDPPAGRERYPVCNVSAKDAEDFAQWLSNRDGVKYRLPTEEEWEYAARNGTESTPFPWGNSWVEGRANINRKLTPTDVGSFPQGVTQSGLQDMIGNVWEWTSSKASYYDQRRAPEYPSAHIRRGGSFADTIDQAYSPATDRAWIGDEHYKFPTIGFRLARDGPRK